MPKTSWVDGPSLTWNRGSASAFVERSRSIRPSIGAADLSAGKETANLTSARETGGTASRMATAARAAAMAVNRRRMGFMGPSLKVRTDRG